jgi:hypothetical protein
MMPVNSFARFGRQPAPMPAGGALPLPTPVPPAGAPSGFGAQPIMHGPMMPVRPMGMQPQMPQNYLRQRLTMA